MFERFTDRARLVLVFAQEEARRLNDSFIGTEHILLGLIRDGESLAAKALEELGISHEAVREKVKDTVGPVRGTYAGSLLFTPRTKKVLALSLREAIELGNNYIGTEHILLGVISEGEGDAAQVLRSLGADLPRVRHQVIQLLAGCQASDQRTEESLAMSPEETFTVHLFREPRVFDRFRQWAIILDGHNERSIDPGETVVFSLPVGRHVFEVGGNWQMSHERLVRGWPRDVFNLTCQPRRPTLLVFLPFGLGAKFKHDLFFVSV